MTRPACLVFWIASLSLAQEVPPDRTIRGTVLDAVSGAPIARATVRMGCVIPRTLSEAAEVLTDVQGGFKFMNLPISSDEPTICEAFATRLGYVGMTLQHLSADPVVFRLVPQSVITGTVLDENGQPLPYAQLALSRRVLSSGIRTMQPAGNPTTDDRGRFRSAGLAAGSYRICVTPPRVRSLAMRGLTYDRVCSPVSSLEQMPLRTGETRDLRIEFKPVAGVRVSGHISNAASLPYFRLSRETADGLVDVDVDNGWNAEKSTFELALVIPGKYRLSVECVSPTRTLASKTIVVGSSGIVGLDLTLGPIPQLEGVITSDDGSALPPGLRVIFERRPSGSAEYGRARRWRPWAITGSSRRGARRLTIGRA